MIIPIHGVLSPEQVQRVRQHLDAADWEDGSRTAGTQAQAVKQNLQLAPQSTLNQQLGDLILDALSQNQTFISAALPHKTYPPMFNRYRNGGHYGWHVDNALRVVPGTPVRVRTDLSCTLFLSEPESYAGGELVIQDTYGEQRIKLNAGDLILYPSTSLHQVLPVTEGERVSAFFWIQSMIREDQQRQMLFELDQSIQELSLLDSHTAASVANSRARLSALYQNLMRRWAQV